MRNSTRCAALALLLVLAPACGDDDDSSSDDGGGTDTTEEASGTTAAEEGGEESGEQCSDSGTVAAVAILDFAFDPAEVSGSSGEDITVENLDGTTHTFTSDDLGFDCEIEGGGGKATVTIDADPGEYEFHCTIHPSMTGTITIE